MFKYNILLKCPLSNSFVGKLYCAKNYIDKIVGNIHYGLINDSQGHSLTRSTHHCTMDIDLSIRVHTI